MYRYMFGICLLLWAWHSGAQTPFLRHYGLAEGLPNLQLYDVYGAQNGLLYLGTSEGLMRFNGVKFEKLPFVGLPSSVSYLSEDADGHIWCKDFTNKLFVFTGDSVRSVQFSETVLDTQGLAKYLIAGDTLFLAGTRGLYAYHLKTKIFKTVVDYPDPQNEIVDVVRLNNELIVLSSNGLGAYQLSDGKKSFYKVITGGSTEMLVQNGLVYSVTRGNPKQPILIYDPVRRQISSWVQLPKNIYGNFLRWWQNNFYWCTNEGIYTFDSLTQQFKSFALPGKRISDLHTDARGNHWIATLDDGLYLMPDAQMNFVHQLEVPGENITRLFSFGEQQLAIGTNFGRIMLLNEKGKVQKIFDSKLKNDLQFLRYDDQRQEIIHAFGSIGLRDGKKKVEVYLGSSLDVDHFGNYLFSSPIGSVYLLRNENEYIFRNKNRISYADYPAVILRPIRARFVRYHEGWSKYLVAYNDGLISYTSYGESEPMEFRQKPIIATYLLPVGTEQILIGTMNQGLLFMEGAGAWREFNQSNGLSGNLIKKVVAGEKGKYWILTDAGIDYLDLKSGTISSLHSALGLKKIQLADLDYVSGMLYLASQAGLLQIPATTVVKRPENPEILQTSWFIDQKKLELTPRIKLPNGFNTLEAQVLPVHFTSEGRLVLQYRIDNQGNWLSMPAGNDKLIINNLPAGKHRISLRLTANGVYSKVEHHDFEVAYPFWMRWWFWLPMLLLFTWIIRQLSLQLYRKNEKERRNQQLLADSQLTAIKAQMNPHFLYNVLNSIQGLIYADKKAEATDYLGKFSDLMRLTLNLSDKQWQTIGSEVAALELYLQLEAGRFDRDFSYEIRTDACIKESDPIVPSMLIQPYVENAIKHGLLHKSGPKRVVVDFSMMENDKKVLITIEDNGIGRKQSATLTQNRPGHHKSFATKANQNRIELLNSLLPEPIEVEIIDKTNTHQQATGTLVILRIPIKPATE